MDRDIDDAGEREAARLVEAIGLGNRRRITAGLAENARDFPRGPWRTRAVVAAVQRVADDILAEVLAAGGDPDARSDRGKSALALAADRLAAGKVRLLIAAGADPRGIDDANRYLEVSRILLHATARRVVG
jgi:hypothetical protein